MLVRPHASASMASPTKSLNVHHHLQAELFGDQKMLESILSTSDPKRIKSYGRKVANFDEGTWVQARYDIVVQGNWLKFSQDKGLKAILLGTGQTLLVEAAPTDRWVTGQRMEDGSTASNLGLLAHAWPYLLCGFF